MTSENNSSPKPVILFFDKARNHIIGAGYEPEIDYVQDRFFKDMDERSLCWEAAFVILASSGLKEQIVRKNFEKLRDAYVNDDDDIFAVIPNKRQREAIRYVWMHPAEILQAIRDIPNDADRIEFLDTLPQIGPITKFHLARNLGIDCIKPDIWLERLAEKYGYINPVQMCFEIQAERPEFRIGTIDLILWRYCNLVRALS